MWSHGIPDVMIDLCPLIQGFYCPALKQVLVPVTLLPQHSRQNLLGTCRHLYGHLPQPQWKTIVYLQKQRERPLFYIQFFFMDFYYGAFYVYR